MICVVEAFSSSFGTASCSSEPWSDGISSGNMWACANALGASARAATRTPARANARHTWVRFMISPLVAWLRKGERGRPARAQGACEQPGGCRGAAGGERLRPARGARLQQPPQDAAPTRRAHARTWREAASIAAAASESASRIGTALRCTGPSRHCHQCMCMPAREWIQVSSAANAASEPPPSRTLSSPKRASESRGARAGRELERVPLAHAQRGEPEHAEREQRRRAQRDGRRSRGAAGRRARPRAASASPRRPARGRRGARGRVPGAVPQHARAVSSHPQRKRRGQQLAAVRDLEEQPPACRSPAAGRRARGGRASCCGRSWPACRSRRRRPDRCRRCASGSSRASRRGRRSRARARRRTA